MNAPDPEQQFQPTVSVIIATYNRPDVLPFAIRSVLAQKFGDWELIVIGDCCDERTAAAVAAFDDPRIRYANLALNYGEQSGPNNVGISRARGRYIAFINQDDLWFPDHLRSMVDWLQASGADLVIARCAAVFPPQPAAGSGNWTTTIFGAGRGGRYDPVATTGPASGVLLKREVARAIGPWRPGAECCSSSSQDWLFRAWRRGFALRCMPHLSVIQLYSASRPQSYLCSNTSEHASFEELLKMPAQARLTLLERCVQIRAPLWKRAARPIALTALRAMAQLGFSPKELVARLYMRYRRGAFIDELRRLRGLAPLAARDPTPAALRERYSKELDG